MNKASIKLLLGLLLFAGNLQANNIQGEVVEAGLFEMYGPSTVISNSNTLDGREENAPAARFYEQTDLVPAILGASFGFRFKVTGISKRSEVTFKTKVTHQPIVDPDGDLQTGYEMDTTLPVSNGTVSEVTGYGLELEQELVEGLWTFEHWLDGQKVVSQSFQVVSVERWKEQKTNAVEQGAAANPYPLRGKGLR